MSFVPAHTTESTQRARLGVRGAGEGMLPVALVLAIGCLVALALWPTTRSLLDDWTDTNNLTYTHGFLVVAVSVWSILRARGHLARAGLRPFPIGAVLVAVISLLWLIAYQAGLLVVHQALLPVAMWMGVLAICGWAVARECAFAFAYLCFAVPVWSLLNSTLQVATTVAMKVLLPVFGVPTYFAGNTVFIPAGVFEIAGGCSGLHFFIVGLAIAAFYGDLHRDRMKTRLLLLVAAAILAILANWIRVFTIIVAGHLTDMQHFLVRVDHYYFGWFVFAAAMVLFFLGASRLLQAPAHDQAKMDSTAAPTNRGRLSLAIALTGVAISVGPLKLAGARAGAGDPLPATLPPLSGSWVGPNAPSGGWLPRFSRADATVQGTYLGEGREVEVFVAFYREQHQGKEFSGMGNSVLGETLTAQTGRRAVDGRFGERIVTDISGAQWVLWDRYQVGTRPFLSSTLGQLWYGVSSLYSSPVSTVLAVRSKCEPDCEAAHQANARFIEMSNVGDHIARY